jgi:hypothetical protein
MPQQLTVAYGMLQQLALYENSMKMQYNLSNSTSYEKVVWRKEHGMKRITDRYREFQEKRASVVRKLYKDYLLPTKMISEMLMDSERNIRMKGFKGMLINDDIPKWLLDVTSRIITEEEDNINRIGQ